MVADVVVVGVDVVVVWLELVVVVGVLELVVVLLVLVLLDVVVVEAKWQSRAASTATVLAPCLRLLTSVRLIELGRFETDVTKSWAAFVAVSHWPELTAEETCSSFALRPFA